MSSILLPKAFNDQIPQVKDKLIYDLINGLDVANDHNQVFKDRKSKLGHIISTLNGVDSKRQAYINDHVDFGLQATHEWLEEINADITNHAHGINKINQSIQQINDSMENVVNFTADFKEEFFLFRSAVQSELTSLDERLSFQETKNGIKQHIESLFLDWKMGSFNFIHPLGRAFLVLDRLYWGTLGEFIANEGVDSKDVEYFIKLTLDHLHERLKDDFNLQQSSDFVTIKDWLSVDTTDANKYLTNAIEYQGDWTLTDKATCRHAFTATQVSIENKIEPLFYMQSVNTVTRRLCDSVLRRAA